MFSQVLCLNTLWKSNVLSSPLSKTHIENQMFCQVLCLNTLWKSNVLSSPLSKTHFENQIFSQVLCLKHILNGCGCKVTPVCIPIVGRSSFSSDFNKSNRCNIAVKNKITSASANCLPRHMRGPAKFRYHINKWKTFTFG
jgi:hypothetical protein